MATVRPANLVDGGVDALTTWKRSRTSVALRQWARDGADVGLAHVAAGPADVGTLSGCEMVVGERVVGRASLATADPDDPAAIEGGDQRGVLVALPVVTSSTSQVYVAESAGNDQWTVTSWNSCMRSFSWSPHVAELRADGGAGVRVRAALQEEEFRRSARRALEAVGQAAVVQVTKARAGSSMALRFLELTGRGLLPKHRDQACSFTDCTSFVVMHQLRVSQVITSDEHFRIAGFEVLPEDG
jgi:hypothetical protein